MFLAHAPLFSALGGSNFGAPASLPGFGNRVDIDNRVLSLQHIHSFRPSTVNETRFGYSFIRHDELPQESVEDSAIGMQRSTASQDPGLPLIVMGRDEGGAAIGTSDITYRGSTHSLSVADTLAVQRGRHSLRLGGEIRHSEWRARAGVFSYGEIDFPTFKDFLVGNTGVSQFLAGAFGFAHLGTGLQDRDFITTDYHLFVQDDLKVSSGSRSTWACATNSTRRHTIRKVALAVSTPNSIFHRPQWTAMAFPWDHQREELSRREMPCLSTACQAG